ncbi:zinc finger CCCH domain-containing protein 11A [Labrus mixtus]|uniref:zinc finger CCCH domain-containing protein 11A n=1 Tax=Labrus mixtus TaxID=508554 RepID=UPI0029C04D6D|nr:zinc finger CCCH domain-containing protein 11A [Labrus mixtus]
MNNNGDDCYFFYYSNCSKGDSCPFRHCEAAMGNETVCNLWQEGRCFRTVCKFRHMEITKNRKEISCYWENQMAGCQKPHCAFFHEKPRYIDGMLVPADKSQIKSEELPQEEPAPAPAAPLPTAAANPQLRGVIKTEAQEPVPSPTHPPVVINPADDDEDEDDQFSEEGEDGKVGPSPRKLQKSGDSLNFGVSTLEEIRLRKALKASMKRAGYPIQTADASTNGEKENIRSLFHPSIFEPRHDALVFEETGRPRGSVAERLGRKMSNTDSRREEGVSLKRSLAERLGRVVEEEDSLMPPKKALKPVKERLGLSAGSVSPSHPAETNTEPKKAPEQIRIKTLEQIKQEKAAKSQNQKDDPSSNDAPEPSVTKNTATKPTRGGRRAITVKDDCISEVKTFSEILRAKKKRQEEEQQEQSPSPKKTRNTAEKAPAKSRDADGPGPDVTDMGEVRVKTLEEIRREKAARMQTQQTTETENKKSSDSEENGAKKPRLMRIKKPAASESINGAAETTPEVTEKPQKSRAAAPEANGVSVKVKTFEEIMQEKRLRKLEMEEQAKNSAEAEPSQKPTPEEPLKRKSPARVSFKSTGSSSPSSTSQVPDTTTSTQKLPVRKLIPFKSKAASPPNSTTGARGAVVTSVPATQSSPPPETDSRSQSPSSSREVPDQNTRTPITLSPTKQARAAPRGAAAEEKTLNSNKKTTPEHTADTRVRPKLNVKPSVVKPAVQVKPGQKRKAAERSAVAAVKPLNSASSVQEESLQEKDKQVSPSSSADALLSSAVPSCPSNLLDSVCSSSPLTEDLQTVPVFSQSLGQESKSSVPAAREACTVPQSPVLKTPAQPKSRRLSAAASRSASASSSSAAAAASSSAFDDFDELISEFTDDHMEGDMDPAIGEDDLLQELSEMIDS